MNMQSLSLAMRKFCVNPNRLRISRGQESQRADTIQRFKYQQRKR